MVARLPSPLLFATALAAAAAPSLLVYNVAPSPTFLNQALAFALWGAWVAVCGWQLPGRGAAAVLWTLALLAGAALWSWAGRGLPSGLALSALGMLAACALLVLAGNAAAAGEAPRGEWLFALFCWAWVGAGVLNLSVAIVQVFAPNLADGHWIAVSTIAGRAIGNLRQPNHLSSLLMWSGVAAVGLLLLRRLALVWAAALLAAMVFGVVLTASRTGGLSVGLLALWGLLDRRLGKPARLLLLAAPLMYAAAWWGLAQWAAHTQGAFGGAQRLAEADISGSRFGIWANTWQLVVQQPWAGVGFGNFNLAWTLTPFPNRPVAFFDHSHNLPLQLAVELGLPMAATVMALLLWALWRGWRRSLTNPNAMLGNAQRCALMMVLMIGLHSLLEYPLWYAYFLLPAGWALGFARAGGGPTRAASSAEVGPADEPSGGNEARPRTGNEGRPRSGTAPSGWALPAAGLLLMLGAVATVTDYRRVTAIYHSANQVPLAERIKAGQHSLFFGHHADYAAATSGLPSDRVDPAFDRASHYLLDTRLMIAWAQALAAQGDLDRARHIAARLREFRKPEAKDFFADCPGQAAPVQASTASSPAANFACQGPATVWSWDSFLKTAR